MRKYFVRNMKRDYVFSFNKYLDEHEIFFIRNIFVPTNIIFFIDIKNNIFSQNIFLSANISSSSYKIAI